MNNISDNYKREGYNVAIYCRLSNDDGENVVSNSIENQRTMLTKYVAQNGWSIYETYMDDGYTGTNFDRPAFKRLIKDIEKGNVSMVITKDMSRLGRDYIQVGFYIERYFPEQGVRYIAVNDGVDTAKDGDNDLTPFKAIINDMYSKDISKKIRSVFDLKRQEGKFIGSFAPYGYKKDSNDKNHLIIDEDTSPIVRRIFHMYLSGKGLTAIAKELNQEGILPPAAYKSVNIKTYHHGRMKTPKWCHSGVKHILTNTTYTGDLAQGKAKKINYKSKKIKRFKREEWLIIEDTHKSIVSREEFNQVQNLMNQRNKNYGGAKKSVKLFSGFVFCGDCKGHMTYHKMPKGYYFLICSTYKKYGKNECSRHSILEKKLEEMILEDILKLVNEFANIAKLEGNAKKMMDEKGKEKEYKEELSSVEKRLDEMRRILKSLYEDKVKGIMDERELLDFYHEFHQEKDNLLERKKGLMKKLEDHEKGECDQKIKELIYSVLNVKKLSRMILMEFVEKIEIFEGDNIKIHYKMKNPK